MIARSPLRQLQRCCATTASRLSSSPSSTLSTQLTPFSRNKLQGAALATERLSAVSRQFSTTIPKMAPVDQEYDFLVIGGGSGGIACARACAGKYGAKVAVIEGKRLGGTCVNVGCVPKKVTWNAADIRQTMKDAKAYGFTFEETAPFDWEGFVTKRDKYVERLNGIYEKNLKNDKVDYYHGHAEVKAYNEVEVTKDDGSKHTLRCKKLLLASGGFPTKPQGIEGAELGTDSDGFFEIKKQPKAVALVGAGYIAVEFAGMFHALGVETHLFIRHDKFLRPFDPILQDTIMQEYERQGIIIHKNSSQSKVEKIDGDRKKIHYEDSNGKGTVEVDHLIWAIGRAPDVEALHLDKLGVSTNEKGHIKVDEYQNTNVENIYALGDVCDRGFELTPVAIAAGRRLADRLFGGLKDAKLSYENIPSVVFAHPEAGSIGLTEPQAREKYGDKDIKIYKTNFTAMFYAMMEPEDKGPTAYKLICQGPNEKVVGMHICGVGSSEMLQGFGVAVKMGATKADFDKCVAIHPTSAEELVTMK